MRCVESASSCLLWFASPPDEKNKEGLAGRVCFHWRMIPGMIALAATICATVCSLLWNTSSLSFIFIPGSFASLYLIYMGWNYKDLKTFAENNEIMESKLNVFQTENTRLINSNNTLGELVGNLKSENVNLAQSNHNLQQTVTNLKEIEKTLDEKAGAHVEQLSGLQGALTKLQASSQEDHTTFSQNLDQFVEQVKNLKAVNDSFAENQSEVVGKMKSQITMQLAVATQLEGIFKEFKDWKDQDDNKKRIETNQELKKKVRCLETQIARNEGMLEEQGKQIKELEAIKGGFGLALKDLIGQISELSGIVADIKHLKENVESGGAKREGAEQKFSQLIKTADGVIAKYADLLEEQRKST